MSTAARLAAVLSRHTTTPGRLLVRRLGRLRSTPATELNLAGAPPGVLAARGAVDLAATNLPRQPAEQSAGVWWPDDRSWFVATHST